MALPPPPPDSPELRTSWVAGILIGTIKRGGFMINTIWVQKEVWYQTGQMVGAQVEKIACLNVAADLYEKLATIKQTDSSAVINFLEALSQDAATIQNHLVTVADTISEVKLNISHSRDKKMYALRKSNVDQQIQNAKNVIEDEQNDTSAYAEAILKFLTSALSVEKILVAFERDEKIFELAKRVNQFVSTMVVMILQDLVGLLKDFMNKSREHFLSVPSLVS